jgi:hypothetical protein
VRVEVADIFGIHGQEYREKYGDRMLPSHLKAMEDIEQCRTEALGGHAYYCEKCDEHHYSYHSCNNRHCPKCQNDQAEEWLQNQRGLLLPVIHFMATFTLPDELRDLARSHQKTLYNILFRSSAAALQELAKDPRFLGGIIGMMGVLQTWRRDLGYHPHILTSITSLRVGDSPVMEANGSPAKRNFSSPRSHSPSCSEPSSEMS